MSSTRSLRGHLALLHGAAVAGVSHRGRLLSLESVPFIVKSCSAGQDHRVCFRIPIPTWVPLLPVPRTLNDHTQVGEMWPPTEFSREALRSCTEDRRVAGAPRCFPHSQFPAQFLFYSVAHLPYRVIRAGTDVINPHTRPILNLKS